tara:strand:+ start:125 stop:328 length:204 start_codon:yes stop_codon:yes gene_type:complete
MRDEQKLLMRALVEAAYWMREYEVELGERIMPYEFYVSECGINIGIGSQFYMKDCVRLLVERIAQAQ